MGNTNAKDIVHRFSYHRPDGLAVISHSDIREAFCTIALAMDQILPDGREKAVVQTKLEEGMFWANAAIAREVKGNGTSRG